MLEKTSVNQIINDYKELESNESDAWSPVSSEFELSYRIALLHAASNALQKHENGLDQLKILDVGCGNGRSTRMYLDLGLKPEQLIGIDVRKGAISLAKKLAPSIRYEVNMEDISLFAKQSSINWIQLTTVLSSIKNTTNRQNLVDHLWELLPKGGLLFYFDLVEANEFAGGDAIYPVELFSKFNILYSNSYQAWRITQELKSKEENPIYLNYCRLKTSLLSTPASHEALLFQKD